MDSRYLHKSVVTLNISDKQVALEKEESCA